MNSTRTIFWRPVRLASDSAVPPAPWNWASFSAFWAKTSERLGSAFTRSA